METSNVTVMAYLSAAVVAGLLTLTYVYQLFKEQKTALFAPAALVHTLLLGSIVAEGMGHPLRSGWMVFLECLHFSVWSLAIYLTLKASSSRADMPVSLKVLFTLSWPITLLALVISSLDLGSSFSLNVWLVLSVAIIALVSVEQLFRFISNDRQLKLLCMSLTALFLFDIYLFTHAFIFQQLDPVLWQARAAVSLGVFLFMALGGLVLMQHSNRPTHLALSRPIAFYTTSLFVVGSLITVLALGGYYVRLYGGNWGTVIYSLLLVGAVLLIMSVFVSSTIRSRLSVLVNKHLFRYKYDYRTEWLRLINYLAQPVEADKVAERTFFAIASITKTPAGAVWVLNQGYYEPVFQSGLPDNIDLPSEPADSPFCQTFLEAEWVYFPGSGDNPALGQYNEHLPAWTNNIPNLWLLFPLIVGDELVGFVALTKPIADASLTWEDLDLLKTMGRQLANYLKRHQQAEQLAEGRQFDTYNKLVAFIIHDLNNLIAQQALVVRNAEKHKHNPQFIDDAVVTISNSVDRMNRLLKKLRTDGQEQEARLSVSDVVKKSVTDCWREKPKLVTDIEESCRPITADEVRLVMTFTHFIKNALEATPEDGEVRVTLRCEGDAAKVQIIDTGSGMDWDFIHNRLFKPFETTKSGKGMGIGVYLSREYINELGGTLNVHSAIGEGTCVTVTLPLEPEAVELA